MAVVLENSLSIRTIGGVLLDFDVGEISNSILLIGIGFRNSSMNFTPNISDNLGSFQLIDSIDNENNVRVEIWAQLNPVAGTHGINVEGTTPTSVPRGIAFALFSGVDLFDSLSTNPITGNGTKASILVTDQVIDGIVFDVMASMQPTAVTKLNPSISTQLLNVGVTGAMVASQTTQTGIVDTVGWTLSVAKAWAIVVVKLNPFVPTPELPPTAHDVRQRLSATLVNRMNTVSIFGGRVLDHGPGELIEYPSCVVTSDGFYDDVSDQTRNIRTYKFTVTVFVNVSKGKREHGQSIERRMEDAVFAALDNYQDFGGSVLWQKPKNGGWAYSPDNGIGYFFINIEAKKQVDVGFV